MSNDALNIGKNFLGDMDRFVRKSYITLKCNEIFNVYFGFSNAIKEFRGTSSGFTGLSELLIFRCLYHQLDGKFEKQSVTEYINEFSNGNTRIGQNTPVTIGERRINPDITIYHPHNELIAVIQIKVYLTRGIKEAKKEIETLEELKNRYRKLRALLIIFYGLSEKGKIFRELEKQQETKEWFNFLILKEDNEPLMEKLQDYLDLERITGASPNSG